MGVVQDAFELHESTPIVDLHCHPVLETYMFRKDFEALHEPPLLPTPLNQMQVDLPKLIRGGVSGILSTIYVLEKSFVEDSKLLKTLIPLFPRIHELAYGDPFTNTNRMLDEFESAVNTARSHGWKVSVAKSFSDFNAAVQRGEIAIMQAVEGGHSLGMESNNVDDYLSNLKLLHDRGVGMLIIAHLYENKLSSCVQGIDPRTVELLGLTKKTDLDKGLTKIGESVVQKMWELGMIVDLTHSTPATRSRVFEMWKGDSSKRPVIFSHVGTCANEFNYNVLTPDSTGGRTNEIRQIADTGGVVGVIFDKYWLTSVDPVPVFGDEKVLENILTTVDTVVKYGGIESVAIGTDFDGWTPTPSDLTDMSDMWKLTAGIKDHARGLFRRHYSDTQIAKFLGGNALRVLKDGWK